MLGAIVALASLSSLQASALELFGVSILGEESANQDSGLAYTVSLEVEGDDADLTSLLSTTSLLITQSENGAADTVALVARARADVERMVAALYSEARYGADIDIRIADIALDQLRPEDINATSGTAVPVVVRIKPGPRFRFGTVTIAQSATTEIQPPLEPRQFALVSGEPAKSEIIVAAMDKLVEEWRAAGYPLAQIAEKDIAADHLRSAVDVRLVVAPGSPAVYGWINVTGATELSSSRIAAHSGLVPGRKFNAVDLKKTRERLRKFESIDSVRVIEGDSVDDSGGIPITVEVTERKPRFFGATASASTIDGAEVQAYWGHRNLFGEGERLRVDGTVSQIGTESLEQLQFDVGAAFTKPGVFDVDTDLFSEFRFVREHPDTYESRGGNVRVGFAHRFHRSISGSVALEGSRSRIDDAFGDTDYTLLALPSELVYDTRNNRLDPSTGINAMFRFSPTAELSGGSAFAASDMQIASYFSLAHEDRAIFAGRIFAGSDFGASLAEVPATDRFFAGGGGSVRGYEYRSLGPTFDGRVVGGLSIIGGSAELRLRVTELIGIVPFIDVATVSPDSIPSFSEAVYIGTGVGLRYYTSLGPVRIDVAAPLTHREGQPLMGVYVGLGQAF